MLSAEQIRPQELMRRKEGCIEADRKFLLDRKAEWVDVPCPACQQIQSHLYGTKNGFSYVECDSCQTVYANPRPSLELLVDFYRGSQNYDFWNQHIFPATEDVRRERIFKPRAERLAQYVKQYGVPMNCLVEVGAAFGTFCQEVTALELFDRVVGIEPTPGLAQTCRERGLEVREQFVEQIEEEEFADVVCSFEVIEHLFRPQQFIQQCARLLHTGGLLVLSCPNVRGLDVSLMKMASGTFDHEHLNYFHPQSLETLVESVGFEVLTTETPGSLDLDIFMNFLRSNPIGQDWCRQHAVLQDLASITTPEVITKLQDAFSVAGLSSHLWIVARKR